MAVVKNKSTETGREFWSHVESIAKQVRTEPQGSAPELPALEITQDDRDRSYAENSGWDTTVFCRERQLLEALAQLQAANKELERAEKERDDARAVHEGSELYKMYVWRSQPSFTVMCHARNVSEAREMALEESGAGDGSCPEREAMAEFVRDRNPDIFYRACGEAVLTDSAELREQEIYAEGWKKRAEAAEAKLAAVPACKPISEEELERMKHPHPDYLRPYGQGWNDGIDKVLSRLREVQGNTGGSRCQ